MITKMSHTTLFVLDQEKAYDFYVNKLGFKVNTDVVMDGQDCGDGQPPQKHRWLTLNPPDQPDLEIILMPPAGLEQDAEAALRLLLERGLIGAGVWQTTDCRATYEELKKKSVDITEPREQFYGIECVVKDGCGNWFSLTQPAEIPVNGNGNKP
jgi:catechol 2,3-dioxygenase-like lactoylglutathione lyase family enzyme